jgi:phage shock protein PspC (stress-responsive transcriptional regulator)
MGQTEPSDDAEPKDRPLRRILVIAAIALAALMLAAVAMYAIAFLILAPMMQ